MSRFILPFAFLSLLAAPGIARDRCGPVFGDAGEHRHQGPLRYETGSETTEDFAGSAGADTDWALFDPALVWSPIVEQLGWSDIRPHSLRKPWLASPPGLGPDQVVVKGVAGSGQSAASRAVDEQLLPRLATRMELKAPWQRRIATRRIQHELQRGPLIVDRFEQTFLKTVEGDQYEVFTRDAVLLDLSPENMRNLGRHVHRDLRRGGQVRTGALAFAAIVISIGAVVCWIGTTFLDRVTQGYYVWPIRLTAAVIMLGTLGTAAGITFSILQTL